MKWLIMSSGPSALLKIISYSSGKVLKLFIRFGILHKRSLNGNISLSEPMNIFEYDLNIKYPQNWPVFYIFSQLIVLFLHQLALFIFLSSMSYYISAYCTQSVDGKTLAIVLIFQSCPWTNSKRQLNKYIGK